VHQGCGGARLACTTCSRHREASKPDADAAAQGSCSSWWGRGPRGNKCTRQSSDNDDGDQHCSVHNSKHHSAKECREIKKLAEQVHEQQKQLQCQDGTPPQQREGKQKAVLEDGKDEELEYQGFKRVLKAVYGHFDSYSSNDDENGYHGYHVPWTQ
jgi:hypothetical protein